MTVCQKNKTATKSNDKRKRLYNKMCRNVAPIYSNEGIFNEAEFQLNSIEKTTAKRNLIFELNVTCTQY